MLRYAQTENGTVKGLSADDPRVTVFKGIPFARPPVGINRWRAPQPAEDWDGVRECFEFAPISMQDVPGLSGDVYCREFHVDPDVPVSEDSLYLNIWTGAGSTSDKQPVLVWIYGGAFQWGYTSEMEFNGERLARHGIIVVSVAYRLGAFGFLAHPDLTKEDPDHPTNFGLLDQQAALAWVYRNIAAFGGDPDNITIAGQSAGGASVSHLVANDQSRAMIKRAAVFSGFIHNPFCFDELIGIKTIDKAEENGRAFIEYIGCRSVDEARAVDAEKIRDAYADYAKDHPRFVPCLDEKIVKGDTFEMIQTGEFPDVPLLTGYTNDEFMTNVPARADSTDSVIRADIVEKAGLRTFNVVQNSVRDIAYAHVRNNMKAPLYTYRFAPDIPGDDGVGCFHSCDLWFWFETIQKCYRPYNGKHYMLAKRMCDHFVNFIKNGDPNGTGFDGRTLPVWKYAGSDDPSGNEMIFTEE